jgi:hypothetical protein
MGRGCGTCYSSHSRGSPRRVTPPRRAPTSSTRSLCQSSAPPSSTRRCANLLSLQRSPCAVNVGLQLSHSVSQRLVFSKVQSLIVDRQCAAFLFRYLMRIRLTCVPVPHIKSARAMSHAHIPAAQDCVLLTCVLLLCCGRSSPSCKTSRCSQTILARLTTLRIQTSRRGHGALSVIRQLCILTPRRRQHDGWVYVILSLYTPLTASACAGCIVDVSFGPHYSQSESRSACMCSCLWRLRLYSGMQAHDRLGSGVMHSHAFANAAGTIGLATTTCRGRRTSTASTRPSTGPRSMPSP